MSSEAVRRRVRYWITRLEGGAGTSLTMRQLLRRHHGIEIGLFSDAPCFRKPGVLHSGTVIGRYCTLADTVKTFTREHPMNRKSSHGLFYNPALGWARTPPLAPGRLEIGHGASIGDNAIILRPTERVGIGAIVAARAVVYRDVPPYAIVEGNPAIVRGFRYPAPVIEELLRSRWWEKPPSDVSEELLPHRSQDDPRSHVAGISAAVTR